MIEVLTITPSLITMAQLLLYGAYVGALVGVAAAIYSVVTDEKP